MKHSKISLALLPLAMAMVQWPMQVGGAESNSDEYQYKETRELVQLVKDAGELLHSKGQAAFTDFRVADSRWRQGETYIFVLDLQGNMLVHVDPALEGKNELELKDVNGRPIVRGLISAATFPGKPDGWYHYQWPVPGGILARWKSTYVRVVEVPAGDKLIVGSGMYNDRMERSFVVDMVKDAVGSIEQDGEGAFQRFHDPAGPFIAKDAYIFVLDMNGVELVNPGFPNLEGRNVLGVKDTTGKEPLREMLKLVKTSGSGWVDYMWPKPGESVPTQKSAYVSKAKLGDKPVLVGCGVYLAEAPKGIAIGKKLTAPELMALVREGASVLEKQGEKAFPEFRQKGSKWFTDDTYLFVWAMDGTAVFHAADRKLEGQKRTDMKDVLGRPYGKMFLETAATPTGEGWVHYMYPEPQGIFPAWKSTFLKRVTFPSGAQYILGSGIYNMDMNEAFIEDVVNRAAALVESQGKEAFGELRDKTGPFVFFETYVFVYDTNGNELVNPGQRSLEGKNILNMKDINGKFVIRDSIDAAMKSGSAWVEYYWFKPGENGPARKHTFVKKVQVGSSIYIVGSGFYPREQEIKVSQIQKTSWDLVKKEVLSDSLTRQAIFGEKGTLAQLSAKRGGGVARHSHIYEEYSWVTSGSLKFTFDDRSVQATAGEVVVIPANVPHGVAALEDSTFVAFFAPSRLDWLRGEDSYLREISTQKD